jgi:AraC-like DNA-binding protein
MTYTQFDPHPALAPYIDAYWTATGDGSELKIEKILPDGCVDIIFNLGADCETDNSTFTMKDEKAYLVGTMTSFKLTGMLPETKLLGIRFKPAAFSAFYNYASLHEVTDQTIEFEKVLSPDLKKTLDYSTAYLNHFFLNKLSKPKHCLLPVVANIQNHKGLLNLSTLAQEHFTTVRQLERNFKRYIGVSPKEFINLVRYQFTLQKIQNNATNKSLLDLAFECGYYDHSHLTNEIKKYTGVAPSQL